MASTTCEQTLTQCANELERKSNAVATKAKRLLQSSGLCSPGPEGATDAAAKPMDAPEGLAMMRKAMAALVSLCTDSASQIKKVAAELASQPQLQATVTAPSAAAATSGTTTEDQEAQLKVALAECMLLRADLESVRDSAVRLQQANDELKSQTDGYAQQKSDYEAEWTARIATVEESRDALRSDLENTISHLRAQIEVEVDKCRTEGEKASSVIAEREGTIEKLTSELNMRQNVIEGLRVRGASLESEKQLLEVRIEEIEGQLHSADVAQRKAEARSEALERKIAALENIRCTLERTLRAQEDAAVSTRREHEAALRQVRSQFEQANAEMSSLKARLLDDHLRGQVATQQKEIDDLRSALLDAKVASKMAPPAAVIVKSCDGTCEWFARYGETRNLLAAAQQTHALEIDAVRARLEQLEIERADLPALVSAIGALRPSMPPSSPSNTSVQHHNVAVQYDDGERSRLRSCLHDMEILTDELKRRFEMVAADALQNRLESESSLARMHVEYQDSLHQMEQQLKAAQFRASRAKQCDEILEAARSQSVAQQDQFELQRQALEDTAAQLDQWRVEVERKSLDLALEVEMLRAKNKALHREVDRLRDDYELKLQRAAMLYEGQTTALVHQHRLELTLRESSREQTSVAPS